jgi:hypothetical protein
MKNRLFGPLFVCCLSASLVPLNGKAADHPHYVQALADLHDASWLIEHRPGNLEQNAAEKDALEQINLAVILIKKASSDDHETGQDHPQVNEGANPAERLKMALLYLEKAKHDVEQDEDNSSAERVKEASLKRISAAEERTKIAINVGDAHHPNYLNALADLRTGRWLIEHRPGDAQQTEHEGLAVKRIDEALTLIKKASIDDGKDVNDHLTVDEKPDRAGRLQQATEFLKKAERDVNLEEDNAFANGLKDQSMKLIAEAIAQTKLAMTP